MPDTTRALSEIHSLLGGETRLRILQVLAGGECSVGLLAVAVGLSNSAASQHLGKLRSGDLVDYTRSGQTLNYRLVEPVHPLLAATLELLGEEGTNSGARPARKRKESSHGV